MIRLTVPGDPVGKARPRVVRGGHAFTPTKTVNYETQVRERFAAEYPGFVPLSGPVALVLTAFFRVPQSRSGRQRAAMLAGEIHPTVKPDVDNLLKIVADSLNGLAYLDDKQICAAQVVKKYADAPRVEITVKERTA